jgi:ABC-type polar amino acid transport system ATPase subunit
MEINLSGLSKGIESEGKGLIDLTTIIPANDITVIIGKNGSGKSTLLNCIAGIVPFQKGTIEVNIPGLAYTLNSVDETIIPVDIRKKIGYVFQHKALWNHLTALENITHPLIHVHGLTRGDAQQKAVEYWNLIQLKEDDLKKYPGDLSGGEQRKVAIVRTLVIEPEFLLIDELEANLDQSALKLTLEIIKTKYIDTKKTVLIVSHNIDLLEQFTPRILLLNNGRLIENAKGINELLYTTGAAVNTTRIFKETLDSSSSRWFFANQSTESVIKISEINIQEDDINIAFTKIGQEILNLITKFDPENAHLIIISTKSKDDAGNAEVKMRCAEKTANFILDGKDIVKLTGIVSFSNANNGVAVYSFIPDHNNYIQSKKGISIGNKEPAGSSVHDSLIDLMFESNSSGLCYKYSDRHEEIKGAYNITIPIDPGRKLERDSYFEFSRQTKNVYLIGCMINGEIKGIISIDTHSGKKWSDFIVQQLILIGNMVAITIKNHE